MWRNHFHQRYPTRKHSFICSSGSTPTKVFHLFNHTNLQWVVCQKFKGPEQPAYSILLLAHYSIIHYFYNLHELFLFCSFLSVLAQCEKLCWYLSQCLHRNHISQNDLDCQLCHHHQLRECLVMHTWIKVLTVHTSTLIKWLALGIFFGVQNVFCLLYILILGPSNRLT